MKLKATNRGMRERGNDRNLAVSPTHRFAVSIRLTLLTENGFLSHNRT
jgi:hypothetical protein